MASQQQPRAFSAYGLPLTPAVRWPPTATGGGARAPQPGSVNALQGLVAIAAQGRTQNPALLGLLGGFNTAPPAAAAMAAPEATPADAFPVGADGDASFSSSSAVTNGRGSNHGMPAPKPKSPTRRATSKSPTRSSYGGGGGGHGSPTSTSAATIGQRTSRSSSISSNATNNTVVSASVNTMPPPPPTIAPVPVAAQITSPTASSFSYTNPFLAFEHLDGGAAPTMPTGAGSQSVHERKPSSASTSVSIKSDPGTRATAAAAPASSRSSTPASAAAGMQGKPGAKKQATGGQVKSPTTTRGTRGAGSGSGGAPVSPRHAKQPHQKEQAQSPVVVDPAALLDSDTPQELATLRPLSPARLASSGRGASATSSTATSPVTAVPAPADMTSQHLAQLAQSAQSWPDASSDAVFVLRPPPPAQASASAHLVSYPVAKAGGGLHKYPTLAKAPADLVPVHVGGDLRPGHFDLLTQSSDGMYVAYVTAAGELVVVDVAARQPLSVLDDTEHPRHVAVAVDMMPKLIAVAYEGGKVVVFKIKRKEGSVVRFGEVQVHVGGQDADAGDADVRVTKVLLLPTMQLIALVESSVDGGFAQYLVKVDVAGMASAGDANIARVVVDLAHVPSVTDESGVAAKATAVKLDSTSDEPVAHLVLSTMSPFFVTCTRSGADLKLWQNLTPARNIVLTSALATAMGGGDQALAVEVIGVHSIAHTDSELVLALATTSAVAIVSVSRAKTKAQMSASILSVMTVAGNNKFSRLSGCTPAANQHRLWLQCDTSAGISSGGLCGYTKHARGMGPVAVITLAPGSWLPTKLARVPLPEYPSADPMIGWSVKGNSLVVASEMAGLWAGSVDAAVVLLGGNAGKAEAVVPEVWPAVVVQVVSGNKAGAIKTTGSVASLSGSAQRQPSPVQQDKEKEKEKQGKKGQPAVSTTSKTAMSKAESSTASSPAGLLQRGGSGSGNGRTRSGNARASPVASPTTPVPLVGLPVATASPAVPVGLTESQLNALLDARLAQLTARLEADHAARLAAESDRQAELVRVLTESLTSTVHSAVATQVQSFVMPAVAQQVAEQLAAMSKDHVKQVKHVQQDVVRACQQVVVDKLVPAYERATQEMFKQVAGAFEKGVERMVEQVAEKVSGQLNHIGRAQNGAAVVVMSSEGEEGEEEEEDGEDEESESGEEESEDEEELESEEDDEFANAADHHQRLTSSSPSPANGPAEDASIEEHVNHLISIGAWDDAFRLAMGSADSLRMTCNLVISHPLPPGNNLAVLFAQPTMIALMVTLAHQLSALAEDEASLDARVRWLQALVNSLDVEDSGVSAYVGQYLTQAVNDVSALEKILVQNMRAGKRSAYLPAVGLLMRTLKSTIEMAAK
ncbi:hypothetical protein BCR44DRAFT_1280232 [Catenaria anguillulae PL171]|uniref:Enhancer of mRNA-decapping protein 4 WD40 repeat region domain-containing protein n=1 Tax=Catenaria anguillulae PL171 TaxID=765915 RepID=A0A1Y2HBF2_9FUNG|nr:hypothetical protein BCR44DRAFT_1280232 [Catenaria anguillulae PL171]